jgi:Xaa-Pro aminopeptidase
MRLKKNSPAQIDKTCLLKRVKGLQQKLSGDLCLIDSPLDLLYYTGLKLSAGYLIVSEKEALLFVDGRYIQMAKGAMKAVLDAPGVLEKYLKSIRSKTLWIDSGRISHDRFLELKKRVKPVQLIGNSSFFQALRGIKDRNEIEKMQRSAQLAYEGFLYIRSILKTGITEREVARKLEIFWLERGAEKLSFEPIIAFGANSAMPHYRAQNVPLKPGDLVLIDIGVVLDQYHSDMTRVLFFQKRSHFFKEVYEVVVAAQKAALAKCRMGVCVADLDIAAREVMREAKWEKHFLHSLGHGIGLETHEYPRLKSQGKDRLELGMVVTVEPGLYFEGKGGIRYEDTVVITESGYENFYPDREDSPLIVGKR